MTRTAVRRLSCAAAVALALTAASCADNDAERAAPIDLATTTTGMVGTDGGAVTSAQVDALVTKLSGAPAHEAGLTPEVSSALTGVQLIATGLTQTEADCVAAKIKGLSPSTTERPATAAGAAGGPSGLDPSVILGCVDLARMSQLASSAPDLTRVPPAALRDVLTKLSTATMTAAGFTPDEAACVIDKGLSGIPDPELASLLSGTAPQTQLRTGIPACLSSERVVQLAGDGH